MNGLPKILRQAVSLASFAIAGFLLVYNGMLGHGADRWEVITWGIALWGWILTAEIYVRRGDTWERLARHLADIQKHDDEYPVLQLAPEDDDAV
jgi:hypothetical protein